jgi:hypothetical protein
MDQLPISGRRATLAWAVVTMLAILPVATRAQQAPGQPPQAAAPLPFGAPVDDHALDATRGGAADVLSNMSLSGMVADSKASDLVTGNNQLTDGALAGASGMPMVIQNTGNNVVIQNATIVNVQLQ